MAQTGSRKWFITITVILASILELIDTSIVNVALPDMGGNLGSTLEDTAWVITAYAIANVIIIPMTGFLSALFGRKKYYIGSIILFVAASACCGASRNIWELVFFRFVQGIGGGGLLSTSQAYLFETFPLEERGVASALFGMGIVCGPILGPTLGGFLTDHYSWPWIFYVNLPLGLIAIALSVTFLNDGMQKKVESPHIDWTGIFFLIVGVGSLQTVLERGQAEDWFHKPYITFLAVLALVSVITFIWWELQQKEPVVNLRVLQSRTLASAGFLTFCLGFCLFGSVFIVPVYCQYLLGFTAMKTGMIMIPGAVGSILVMPNVGRMLQRGVKPQILIAIGFLGLIVFAVMLSHLTTTADTRDFFWPLIIRNAGMGFLFVPLTILAISDLEPKDIPQGTAMNNMIRQLGGSFGIALMNTYIDHREAAYRVQLVSNVSLLSPATQIRLTQLQHSFIAKGFSASQALKQSYMALEGAVVKQTMTLSYLDGFRSIGLICLICVPLVFTIKPKKKLTGNSADVSAH